MIEPIYRRFNSTHLILLFFCLQTLAVRSQHGDASHIVFDHGYYSLNFSNLNSIKWQFDRHYQVYVGSEVDLNILRNVLIETSQEREEKLTDVRVKILRTGMPDSTFGISAFQPQPFDDLIMDHLLLLDDLELGDTIDVHYTIQSKPSTHIHRWTLQYDYPVGESTVTYLLPKVFTYDTWITDETFLTGQSKIDSTLRLSRGKIELVGIKNEFKNIPAFREEPYAPQPIQSRPACLFTLSDFSVGEHSAYLPDWSEQLVDLAVSDVFGKQYRSRSNYRWLVSEASNLLNKRYEDRLLVLKLYQFLHEQLTWDGSYGLIPSHGLAEMQFEKTVNKSGMNMALLALLIEADFKAIPVLVSTTDRARVSKQIADINQFNHFIIEVDLGTRDKIYLDAGEPTLPVGWIDSGIRRDPVARIQNLRGQWATLPEFSGNSMMVINMDVKKDFSASGVIHISFSGYDAFNERLLLESDRQAQYWKDRAASLSPSVRIDSVRFENVTNLIEPFENTVYFHLDGSSDSDELLLNPVIYSFFSGTYFTAPDRQNSIELPFAIVEQCILNINLAPGLQGSYSDPIKLSLQDGKGSVEFHASQKDQKIQSRFKAVLPETQFKAQEYEGLKIFLDSARSVTEKPIVIRKI